MKYGQGIILCIVVIFCSCRADRSSHLIEVSSSNTIDTADHAMVVTAHPTATKAALSILQQGGNAVDAMITAHFVLAVTYPRAGNLGGGGFMVYRDRSGKTAALDFREIAPKGAWEQMYQDSLGRVQSHLSLKGPLASGVPGSVAGMYEAFTTYSALRDWPTLIKPAISFAENGFIIDQREADRLNQFQDAFAEWHSPEENPLLKPSPWREGDVVKQPKLANTLREIQRHKKDGFYCSWVADSIVNYMEQQGGIIDKQDLQEYEAIWREPLSYTYKNCNLITMPPPSSGGVALIQMLQGLTYLELEGGNLYRLPNAHKIIEVERRAYADRAEYLGDPDFVHVPVEALIEFDYNRERLANFHPDHPTPSQKVVADEALLLPESFETTHISIVDQFGNAVAMTTTLNSNYGSKVRIPGTGIFMNNEMNDFSAKPGVPNQFGLVGNFANAIAPEKRMLSSMTPTIVEKDSVLYLIVGSPGGSTIITSVLQVFLWMYEGGLSVGEAIARGRFHHQWKPESVFIESLTPDTFTQALQSFGYPIDTFGYIGLVKGIERTADGRLIGSGDPRSGDHAEGY